MLQLEAWGDDIRYSERWTVQSVPVSKVIFWRKVLATAETGTPLDYFGYRLPFLPQKMFRFFLVHSPSYKL